MDGYLGEIKMFGGNYPPKNWQYCHGQLISVTEFQDLYAVLGITYGGNGTTTFGIPDLRGRIPVNANAGPGLTNRIPGQMGGLERVTLSATQLPPHQHVASAVTGTVKCNDESSEEAAPDSLQFGKAGGDYYNAIISDKTMAEGNVSLSGQVDSAGGGASHSNMQPWTCTNYIICVTGIWPPRH